MSVAHPTTSDQPITVGWALPTNPLQGEAALPIRRTTISLPSQGMVVGIAHPTTTLTAVGCPNFEFSPGSTVQTIDF